MMHEKIVEFTADLLDASVIAGVFLTVGALLGGCSTVQRVEAWPSLNGGYLLQQCLYDKPVTTSSRPKTACILLCTSPTQITPENIDKGVCQ